MTITKKRSFPDIWLISAVVLAFMTIAACSEPQSNQAGNDSRPSASALDRILESGTLRVGTTGDFNPMSFRDADTGEYRGYDIDVVTQLAADMGVEIEFVATDWGNLVSGVTSGRYDMTTGASYGMGRARVAGYTLPIVSVATVPMTLAANAGRYDSWESINNGSTRVAVTLGTIFESQAKVLLPDATLRSVESPAREFQEVLAGRSEVSITSTIEAARLVAVHPELIIVPVAPANSNAIGLLTDRNEQVFINYLNVWITTKTYEGFFAGLQEKWNLVVN